MESNKNESKQGSAKKAIKIIGIVLATLVLLFVIVFAYNYWRISTGRLIKWEGQYYTKDQIKAKYGEQVYDVPSKNTPEEVYTKFREALLKNDIEGALGMIREEKRGGYRERFSDKNVLEKYRILPEVNKIKKAENDSIGNLALYYYFKDEQKKDDVPFDIKFEKNKEGYWQIDGI
ncbi:MAG: hypothetical protein US81_C0017G0006 [Parcubacteria group bacterium GW2011_GWE2_38_18]|nr:MAG: hypothetical protein US81_C0017G0006 [Parcubacteria group bacterium GW2011_GWE2_38_18]